MLLQTYSDDRREGVLQWDIAITDVAVSKFRRGHWERQKRNWQWVRSPRLACLAGRATPEFSARPSFKGSSFIGGLRRCRAPPRLTAPNWSLRCAALPAPKVSSEMLSIGHQGGAQGVFEETPRTGSRAAPKTASRGCAAPPHTAPGLAQSVPSQSCFQGEHRAPFWGLRVPPTASNSFFQGRRIGRRDRLAVPQGEAVGIVKGGRA